MNVCYRNDGRFTLQVYKLSTIKKQGETILPGIMLRIHPTSSAKVAIKAITRVAEDDKGKGKGTNTLPKEIAQKFQGLQLAESNLTRSGSIKLCLVQL